MSYEKITAIILTVLLIISSAALVIVVGGEKAEEAGTQNGEALETAAVTAEATALAPPETDAPPESPTAALTDAPVIAAPEQKVSPKVLEALSAMTLREKICQLFIVYPTAVSSLADYPVGGLVYSASHLSAGGEATIAGVKAWQSQSKIPLLICADEEGGSVNRLMSTLKTTYFSDMFSYKDDGEQTALQNAAAIARDMKRYGFNTDFAPVADVWSNPSNTVIGRRAYSDSFEQAALLVAKAVEGFKSENLICTIKHFPGHGDTAQDSHTSAATVTKSLDELRAEEFLPFKAGIAAGADMVMIGHLTVGAISGEPATVSYEIVTGILREELGFDGVIISDGLEMSAVTLYYSDAELCVSAISAGIDILLGPGSLAEGVAAIEAAVGSGRLSEERIDRSVERILEMKLSHGLL